MGTHWLVVASQALLHAATDVGSVFGVLLLLTKAKAGVSTCLTGGRDDPTGKWLQPPGLWPCNGQERQRNVPWGTCWPACRLRARITPEGDLVLRAGPGTEIGRKIALEMYGGVAGKPGRRGPLVVLVFLTPGALPLTGVLPEQELQLLLQILPAAKQRDASNVRVRGSP